MIAPKDLAELIAKSIKTVVAATVQEVAELKGRVQALEALEARIKAVEDRPVVGLKYRGTWADDPAEQYTAGDFVTRSGSLWCCKKTGGRGIPGSSPDWTLAVKSNQSR